MSFDRVRFATLPMAAARSFGRGPVRVLAAPAPAPSLSISNDMKLFASTFAAGFLFMSVFLA